MDSFSEIPPTVIMGATEKSSADEISNFRCRTIINRRWFFQRRYVLAFMIFAIVLIQYFRTYNNVLLLFLIVVKDESLAEYTSIQNWTMNEIDVVYSCVKVGSIFANILGGLLIYKISIHKFLFVSVILSSILHMLTPATLNHQSIVLYSINAAAEEIISVPIYIAAMSMWKDWAPPSERTRLLASSLCGIVWDAPYGILFLFPYSHLNGRVCYYVGITGIVWAVLWYNITSDTPRNDPLISETELLHLESNIPSSMQEEVKLKDVPWKSILKSLQVLILCLIFFKMSWADVGIQFSQELLYSTHYYKYNNISYSLLLFVFLFGIILLGSAVFLDFLLNKYRSHTLRIRKYFLCSGYLMQFLLLLGTFTSSFQVKEIFCALAYVAFAVSVPGSLTYSLDLSPRYVSIIAGFGFASYSLGKLCYIFLLYPITEWMQYRLIHIIFLADGLMSLLIAIIFGIWGDVQEQQWSLIFPTQRREQNYKCYPRPDDDEDIDLVT